MDLLEAILEDQVNVVKIVFSIVGQLLANEVDRGIGARKSTLDVPFRPAANQPQEWA
jgi:hypothetical protein